MYKIEFSRTAAKELERIYQSDPKVYYRLVAVVESFRKDPFQGKKLKGKLQGSYSARVGHYRIIYSVYKAKLLVEIIDIGHRRDVYR